MVLLCGHNFYRFRRFHALPSRVRVRQEHEYVVKLASTAKLCRMPSHTHYPHQLEVHTYFSLAGGAYKVTLAVTPHAPVKTNEDAHRHDGSARATHDQPAPCSSRPCYGRLLHTAPSHGSPRHSFYIVPSTHRRPAPVAGRDASRTSEMRMRIDTTARRERLMANQCHAARVCAMNDVYTQRHHMARQGTASTSCHRRIGGRRVSRAVTPHAPVK